MGCCCPSKGSLKAASALHVTSRMCDVYSNGLVIGTRHAIERHSKRQLRGSSTSRAAQHSYTRHTAT